MPDSHPKFSKHAMSLVKKIAFGIRVIIKSCQYFPQHVIPSLYYALIHSHLTYYLSCWAKTYETDMSDLDHQQNQAVRLITINPVQKSALPIYQNLIILPLTYSLQIKLVLLIHRIRNKGTVANNNSVPQLLHPNNTRFAEQNNMLLPKVRTKYRKSFFVQK